MTFRHPHDFKDPASSFLNYFIYIYISYVLTFLICPTLYNLINGVIMVKEIQSLIEFFFRKIGVAVEKKLIVTVTNQREIINLEAFRQLSFIVQNKTCFSG